MELQPEEDPRDEIRASIDDFERLEQNPAWQEITSYFQQVKERHIQSLRQPGRESSKADFDRGAIEAYEDIESIVEMFIGILKEEQQDGRHQRRS